MPNLVEGIGGKTTSVAHCMEIRIPTNYQPRAQKKDDEEDQTLILFNHTTPISDIFEEAMTRGRRGRGEYAGGTAGDCRRRAREVENDTSRRGIYVCIRRGRWL